MVFHWIEVLKFIKNKIIFLILGTILIGLTYMLSQNNPFISQNTGEINEENEEIEEIEFITDVRPASFYFFVEQENGESFKNNLLIEQYLLSPEILNIISQEIDLNLIDLIEESENIIEVSYNDSGESKMIGVTRNESTSLIELYVNVGNERDNLTITNIFFDYIINNQVPFLANKKLIVFKKPLLKEIENTYDALSEEQSVITDDNMILDFIVGMILGFILITLFLWIKTLFSKTLTYSFSYSINDTDEFLLIDKLNKNVSDIINFLSISSNDDKKVIVDNVINIENIIIKNAIDYINTEKSVEVVNSITEISKLGENTKLVYIIAEGETKRKWYNKERRLVQLLNIPVLIIQVNKE